MEQQDDKPVVQGGDKIDVVIGVLEMLKNHYTLIPKENERTWMTPENPEEEIRSWADVRRISEVIHDFDEAVTYKTDRGVLNKRAGEIALNLPVDEFSEALRMFIKDDATSLPHAQEAQRFADQLSV